MAIRYGDRTRVSTPVSGWLNDQSGSFLWPTATQTASVTVTASASTHTKGAWTEVFASTNTESGFILYNYTNSQNGVNTSGLLDIAVGASGSESLIFPDLPAGYGSDGMQLFVPVFIPAGVRVSARTQSATANRSGTYRFGLFKPTFDFAVSGVDAINVDAATSGPNTLFSSATTELIASTAADYKALVFAVTLVGATGIATVGPQGVDLRTGASGSEVTIASCFTARSNQEIGFQFSRELSLPGLYVGDVPSGTRLSTSNPVLTDAGMIVYGIKG